MVKVRCNFCGSFFESYYYEYWICPNCEESGNIIFDVNSASYDEIKKSWQMLRRKDSSKQNIGKIIGSNDFVFFGEYHNKENINNTIDALVLLFDKVVVKDKLLATFHDNFDLLNNFENFLDEGFVVGITGFSSYDISMYDLNKYCIDKSKIIGDVFVWENLTKILAREYFNNLKKKTNINKFIMKVVDKSEMDSTYLFDSFSRLLDFNFKDQLLISQLNSPAVLQPYQVEITNCYFRDVMQINKREDLGKEIKIFKKFLDKLSINIPLAGEFDDFKKFRNEKTAKELRDTLSDVTQNSRTTSDYEIVNDLIWQFNDKLNEFNEAVESFSHYRTGVLTGIASTIGGVLGGPEGAIVGGIGGTGSMFLGNCLFKEYYRRNKKDWAYFLWKLKTK